VEDPDFKMNRAAKILQIVLIGGAVVRMGNVIEAWQIRYEERQHRKQEPCKFRLEAKPLVLSCPYHVGHDGARQTTVAAYWGTRGSLVVHPQLEVKYMIDQRAQQVKTLKETRSGKAEGAI
jgi:hypothetical protein